MFRDNNIIEIDKPCISEQEFIEFMLERDYNENMFNKDGTLNKNYNSSKVTGLISTILEDYSDEFFNKYGDQINKYRPNAYIEIKKVIDCNNKDLGCSLYQCPNCGDIVFIGHTCKSRLCTSCGYKYKNERVENILETAYACNHRQIVFTIPKELRPIFYYPYEERIDILFEAVKDTIYSIFNLSYKKTKDGKTKEYKSKTKWIPGFFAFLHTFGRDLKWNPHIHVLIAELKISGDKVCKCNYFDYDALSKRFQKILLDLLSKRLDKNIFSNDFKKELFLNHKNGFYVYAEPKKFKSLKDGVEYVTRYYSRPAISENRIINYDGENVTFSYNAHEDESYHEVTISALEFIKLLIRHLVPYQFKTIRYYGFYRKKPSCFDKINKLINKEKYTIRKTLLKYRLSIMNAFNRDPYTCPRCGNMLNYLLEMTEG